MRNACYAERGSRLLDCTRYVRPTAAAIERLETRAMYAVTSAENPYVSEISGNYVAELLFGDNGANTGSATAVAGTGAETYAWYNRTWDADVTDGIDSGFVNFSFSINADGLGTCVFLVADRPAETFAVSLPNSVSNVTLQLAVGGSDLRIDLVNTRLYFYTGGSLRGMASIPGEAVDTMGQSDGMSEECIVSVAPSSTSYDGVVITGSVRLQAAEGVYPNPLDIFCKIAVS